MHYINLENSLNKPEANLNIMIAKATESPPQMAFLNTFSNFTLLIDSAYSKYL